MLYHIINDIVAKTDMFFQQSVKCHIIYYRRVDMKKPILVVMAAGMGSRYGGLKQMDPIGPSGEVIIDYSIYDAKRAGFETVVFIIKKEIEEQFREIVGNHIAEHMEVRYAFQELNKLPEGYAVPEDRKKPWGTAHAILSAADVIDAPFAVINADDYYGCDAYKVMYDYLSEYGNDLTKPYHFAMVGYLLGNTVSENGHVARGICEADENGHLKTIVERTRIETYENGIHFSADDGATWTDVPFDTIVSMNLWGFPSVFVDEIRKGFAAFLDKALAENPLKGEYFLPDVVRNLLNAGDANVKILHSPDKWYGVTYQADKPVVVQAIADKVAGGLYPANLWAK